MFDSMKVNLCKKALQAAAENTHNLSYGAFDSKTVKSLKNRHAISISTPNSERRRRRQIAFMNIELGNHNKGVALFNSNREP
jgi:hypothetical protein